MTEEKSKHAIIKENNSRIIIAAWTLTAIVVISFFCLGIKNDVLSKPINEIGDAVAGFSSLLAFMWIIVTIYIQSTELRLQYEELRIQNDELKNLSDANAEQAKLMSDSIKINTMEYLKKIRDDYTDFLLKTSSKTNTAVNKFMDQFVKHPYASEFIGNEKEAMPHICCYFIKESANKDKLLDFNIDCLLEHFDYEAYLLLDNILAYMIEAWKVIKPLRIKSIKIEEVNEQIAWEQSLGIYWYGPEYRNVNKLVSQLGLIVAKNKLAYSDAASFMSGFFADNSNDQSYDISI